MLVLNGRVCLRRLWATTSVAIFRMKGTFACLANCSTAAINKWQNDSTLCPIIRATAAATAAEGRLSQNRASRRRWFLFLLTSGGRRWQPARSRFLPAWFPTLAKPAGGRRTTRILVSKDGVLEWRPGSEAAAPVCHPEWRATQMFCQVAPLGAPMWEMVEAPGDAAHPLEVLFHPPWGSHISSTSVLSISSSSSWGVNWVLLCYPAGWLWVVMRWMWSKQCSGGMWSLSGWSSRRSYPHLLDTSPS